VSALVLGVPHLRRPPPPPPLMPGTRRYYSGGATARPDAPTTSSPPSPLPQNQHPAKERESASEELVELDLTAAPDTGIATLTMRNPPVNSLSLEM